MSELKLLPPEEKPKNRPEGRPLHRQKCVSRLWRCALGETSSVLHGVRDLRFGEVADGDEGWAASEDGAKNVVGVAG